MCISYERHTKELNVFLVVEPLRVGYPSPPLPRPQWFIFFSSIFSFDKKGYLFFLPYPCERKKTTDYSLLGGKTIKICPFSTYQAYFVVFQAIDSFLWCLNVTNWKKSIGEGFKLVEWVYAFYTTKFV